MESAAVAGAIIVAAVATGVVALALPRLGVIDIPNHRSSHAHPVPRGGGIGVAAGVAAAVVLTPPDKILLCGLLAALVLAIVGFVDDVRSLPARVRLVAQLSVAVAAAGVIAAGEGAVIPLLLLPVAAVWLAGYVNLFNFMDGANGVAGFSAVIAGGCFAWTGANADSRTLLVGGGALLGAAVGFLPWNFPAARIFLGDVGSYAIGFLVAWLALVGVMTTDRPTWCVAPILVFLLDTTVTLTRRARRREPLMSAHREHVYQRLTTTPGSPLPAGVTTTFSLLFVGSAALPLPATVLAWFLLALAYISMPRAVSRLTGRTRQPNRA